MWGGIELVDSGFVYLREIGILLMSCPGELYCLAVDSLALPGETEVLFCIYLSMVDCSLAISV